MMPGLSELSNIFIWPSAGFLEQQTPQGRCSLIAVGSEVPQLNSANLCQVKPFALANLSSVSPVWTLCSSTSAICSPPFIVVYSITSIEAALTSTLTQRELALLLAALLLLAGLHPLESTHPDEGVRI